MYGDTHLYTSAMENKLNDSMLLKTVCYNVLSLHGFISLQYCLVWTLCVACDQDLGLPLRFVNEVKVDDKVFAQ